jgi:hypothetical protein
MNVLIACEESQEVCKALRSFGHNAWSCDILPCSGCFPQWHLQTDFHNILNSLYWNLLIAFPPCTDLCSSGARWFPAKIADGRQSASIKLFMDLINCDILKIAVENPVGIMSSVYRKPDQIIHPWQFGHGETKATCLWLKNLPKLIPTCVVSGRIHRIHSLPPGPYRSLLRSKTYPGIASAMADQWS